MATRLLVLLALTALITNASAAWAEPFDPASLQKAVKGEHSQVLVLGSPHLMNEADQFERAWLEPLLAALERYRPQAIIVEALSGEAVSALVEYEPLYPGVAQMFAARRLALAREVSALLGTSIPGAEASVRKSLVDWPSNPSASQRRRLCALFVAAGDLNSALVQWAALDASQRVARDGISEAAAAHLRTASVSRNETVSIGVQLARRLGLERLYSMDDQSESDLVFPLIEEIGDAEASASLKQARARRMLARFTPMASSESVMTAFRQHNSDKAGRLDAEHQWLARLETGQHQALHRRRIAAWETRNLRMAANIREVSARYPGQRILVLVGSAHKPYLDAYLRMMADVRVINAADVIGAAD